MHWKSDLIRFRTSHLYLKNIRDFHRQSFGKENRYLKNESFCTFLCKNFRFFCVMISLSKGTGKKKGETNEEKDFGDLMATLTVGSLLSGCGGAQSGDAAGKQESGKQESSDSEEPAEVVFAYMTQNNIPESSELERIQNLINDYTVDKINTKVKLVLFPILII